MVRTGWNFAYSVKRPSTPQPPTPIDRTSRRRSRSVGASRVLLRGFDDAAVMARACSELIAPIFLTKFAGCASAASVNKGADNDADLCEFITCALFASQVPEPVVHRSLILLHRMVGQLPAGAVPLPMTRHYAFLAALIVSAKSAMEDAAENVCWHGIFKDRITLPHLNAIEGEFLALMKGDLEVAPHAMVDAATSLSRLIVAQRADTQTT